MIYSPIGYMVGILVYVLYVKIHEIPCKVVAVINDSERDESSLTPPQKMQEVKKITFNDDLHIEDGGAMPRTGSHGDPKP